MTRGAPALVALLVAFVLPSTAALAQDEWEEIPQRLERSIYLQLGGVVGFENFDGVSGKNSGGVEVRVGLRSSQWLSIEVHYQWLSGMEPAGNDTGSDWTSTLNFRVYPFTFKEGQVFNLEEAQLQPYLLVGAGVTSFNQNLGGCLGSTGCPTSRDFGFSSRWGGGIDFYVTEKIALTTEASYVWVTGTPVKNLSYTTLSFGAIYRFY